MKKTFYVVNLFILLFLYFCFGHLRLARTFFFETWLNKTMYIEHMETYQTVTINHIAKL